MSAVPRVAETLEESARRIGGHAWIEQRLFEILGTWVTAVPELEAKATTTPGTPSCGTGCCPRSPTCTRPTW
jgi:hypothetical protein